jgi:two-component system, sensor histidine kinase
MIERAGDSEEVVVLAPLGRDAALISGALAQAGLSARAVADCEALEEAVRSEAGAAVIAHEVLTPASLAALTAVLDQQPTWSDFPIVLLTLSGADWRNRLPVQDLGNVTLLERPVSTETLLAAVQSALRGRRRQFAAKRAIAQREQFLAMLGHELRNPLGAVQFAADLLGHTPLPEAAERHRQIIARQTRHLAHLVDDLLEVSRVTTGKLSLKLQRVDVTEALQRTVLGLEAALKARKHAVQFLLGAEPVWVQGDPVRLEQVFSNLLGNAIKYTGEGGTISLRLDVERGEAVVRIRDTGIGIDPAMLSRIFEPFTQIDTSLQRAEGGMGLGLAIVRRLVELQGGEVHAHSEGAGKGAEMVVRLPLADESTLAPHPSAPLPAPTPLRLVLVEDNADICDVLGDLLRFEGHEVETANDGVAGAALITRYRPDLALVDIGLPGLNGYQVAERVRSEVGAAVRLVALTGYGQPEDAARALDAGFDRHLKKPIDVKVLTRLLDEVSASR